jgi:DME family drug/metabolite transporter
MFLAGLLALASAATYGVSHVFTKKSLAYVNAATATQFALGMNALLLCVLALSLFPQHISYNPGVWIFVADGAVVATLGRLFLYIGFDRVGVARAAPVSASYPFFAVLFAVVFLHEVLTIPILAGTAGIVFGIFVLSYGEAHKEWRRRDLLFPLMTAVIWGTASNMRKWGINMGVEPLFGSAVSSLTAAVVFPLFAALRRDWKFELARAALPFLIPAGILNGVALAFVFYSLKFGPVVLVSPLASSYPLFSVVFAFLFIPGMERITPRVVTGMIMITIGASLVLSGQTILAFLKQLLT